MHEYSKKSDLAGTVAKVINAGGSAVVSVYDLGAGLIDGIYSTAKRTPELTEKAQEAVTAGVEAISAGIDLVRAVDRKKIEAQIEECEDRLKVLFYEIGKKSSKLSKVTGPRKSDALKKLLDQVRECENKIRSLKHQIVKMEELKIADQLRLKEEKAGKALISALSNIKHRLSVPPLIDMLEDKSIEIREKALTALETVTGIKVEFNVHAAGQELAEAVKKIRARWEKEAQTIFAIPGAEKGGPAAAAKMPAFSKNKLRKMNKAKLIAACSERGIKCSETMTNAELMKLLLPQDPGLPEKISE